MQEAAASGSRNMESAGAREARGMPKKMDKADAHIAALAEKRRSVHQQYMPRWEEAARLFLPDREVTGEHHAGDDYYDDKFTSVGVLARRGLQSAIHALTRPDNKLWFRCKCANPEINAMPHVRKWLEVCTMLTYSYFYDKRARAGEACSEVDDDTIVFGHGVLHPSWDAVGRHLVFRSLPATECVLGTDNKGNVDKLFRFFRWTLAECEAEFGEENLTEKMKDALRKRKTGSYDDTKKYHILHCCMPIKEYERLTQHKSPVPNAKHTYISVWLSLSCKEALERRGYFEFPYVVPRWRTSPGKAYATCPAHEAMNDARLSDVITGDTLESAEMALKPPTYSFGDQVRGELELFAGGHTQLDPSGFGKNQREPIGVIQLGTLPQGMMDFLARVEERLYAIFYRDVLELPSADTSKMTAAEIRARSDQYLRQAGPIFTRLESSYSAPMLNRTFNILLREGVYPDPPEELAGQMVEFEYDSPLNSAREMAEAYGVVEGLEMVKAAANGLPPEFGMQMADNYDPDMIARYLSLKAATPEVLMKDIKRMTAEREQRAQQQEAMMAAEMAAKAGPGVGALAKAGADLQGSGLLGEGSPADAMQDQAAQGQGEPGFDEDEMAFEEEDINAEELEAA